MSFGAWLRLEAERRDLSIRRLAQRSGLAPTTLGDYARGYIVPKPASIAALAKGLDLPEGVVWHAAGLRQPGGDWDEVSHDRVHLRRLVDQVREERVPYAVQVMSAFVRMDDDSTDGQSPASRDAASERES